MADLTTIEIVHARLLARYGSAWRAKYAGIDPETVAKDWLHVLERFDAAALDYGLENLPHDFPPTAGQFREVCRRAPEAKRPALPAPKADPARVAQELGRLHAIAAQRRPRDWIAGLEGRLRRGEPVTFFQRHCLNNAQANLAGTQALDEEIADADRVRTEELKAESARRVGEYQAARAVLDAAVAGFRVSEELITSSLIRTGDIREPTASEFRTAADYVEPYAGLES